LCLLLSSPNDVGGLDLASILKNMELETSPSKWRREGESEGSGFLKKGFDRR
jgi:hypothetical protein